jgi:phenylalanyl-tRNA synthetase beta chain
MKVLLSWLREFAPIEGEPERLADTMSDLGMAVEAMSRVGEGLDGIVVGRVLGLRPHPQADRIQLVDVDAGDGEALQICCGAFNMAVGDLVPLATLGTVMPNGLRIERRKLRGEWSNGMLCSAAELQLGGEAGGIMVLGSGTEPGEALTDALGLEPDVLFDLEINTNRPDAMSVAGVARDLAARLRVPFALPDPKVPEAGPGAASRIGVEILDPDLCGRFTARVLDGVAVGPSPRRLASRLTALGMRPINHVVDVSNYLMLELGQPNHTYDLDKVAGATLRVRMARDGERVVTLDGVERILTAEDGVIADGDDAAIGIAGVMGGASTEISGTTRSVLLELAWWDPMTIARSSRRLGLRSEASARFERGTDPEIQELAARRFAALLLADGGTLAPDVLVEEGTLPPRPRIRVRTARVNAILGTRLTPAEIRAELEPIGFACEPVAADAVEGPGAPEDQVVTVPSWRPDAELEIDVIEEVARHYGYERIGRRVPRAPQTGSLSPRQEDRRLLRSTLSGLGVDEVYPVPFLAPGDLAEAGLDPRGIELSHPLVAEESVLRTSLRPGILKVLAHNAAHRNPDVAVYEIGHVYRIPAVEQRLPDEHEHLGVALAGRAAPDAVRVWAVLADALAARRWRLVADEPAGLHPTRTARIEVAGTAVGWVGEIDPDVASAYEVPGRVAWLELDLDVLLGLPHGDRPYSPVSRFPSSDVDLAFEVDDAVAAGDVERTLRKAAGHLLVGLHLFDVYRGAPLPAGTRSLAFRLRLQAVDRTLTDADVAEVRDRCIAAVAEGVGARLRA